jgi:hypothetical protein
MEPVKNREKMSGISINRMLPDFYVEIARLFRWLGSWNLASQEAPPWLALSEKFLNIHPRKQLFHDPTRSGYYIKIRGGRQRDLISPNKSNNFEKMID